MYAVVINETNLNSGIVVKENKIIYHNLYWHKIFVRNALNFSRDFVLQTLMNAVHPVDFIPVQYKIEGEMVTFLMKNCGEAINELCRLNLTIPYPDAFSNLPAFKISIQLMYAHAQDLQIDMQSNITSILKKRYNLLTKTLNLDSFYKDPDLTEFCPLSQPKLLYFVLHLSKDMEIVTLKLNNNNIELLKGIDSLYNQKGSKKMHCLNIQHNKIKSMHQLSVLKPLPIKELYLGGNPLCDNYSELDYVKAVVEQCPTLIKLDGFKLPMRGIAVSRRNYLCDLSAKEFVDLFLEHYFTLYDSPNRQVLETIYHKDAIFSMSSAQFEGPTYPNKGLARFMEYKKFSRNVKLISDLSKSEELIFTGAPVIAKILSMLPSCEHDPHSFTCDLTYYTETTAVIVVTGVFKESGQTLLDNDFMYVFMRTFILLAGPNDEYNIINDQLHISKPTIAQQSRAFSVVKVPKPRHVVIPAARRPQEKAEMVQALMLITELNQSTAKKFLEDCDYDLKRALNFFVEMFKSEKVPSTAFRFKEELPGTPIVPANNEPYRPPKVVDNLVHINPHVTTPVPVPVPQPVVVTVNQLPVPVQQKPAPVQQKPTIVPKPVPAPQKTATSNASTRPSTSGTSANVPSQTDDLVASNVTLDQVIKDALQMPDNLPADEIKARLSAAASRILTVYTFTIRFYRSIGREFFKHNLLDEARAFLKEAMKKLPKNMSEEVYSLFTLFEIQYGKLEIANSMIMFTAMTFPVNRTVRFIGEHVAKINVPFAREMFVMISKSKLDFEKKQAILVSLTEFELKYGNQETLNAANELCKEIIDKEENALQGISNEKTTQSPVKKRVTINLAGNSKKADNETDVIIIEDTNEDDKPILVEPKTTNAKIEEHPVKIINSEEKTQPMKFNDFRKMILIYGQTLPYEKEDQVSIIENDKSNEPDFLNMCDEMIQKYPKDVSILAAIYKKCASRGLYNKFPVTDGSSNSRVANSKYYINIKCIYKIKELLAKSEYVEAMRKAMDHIHWLNNDRGLAHFLELLMELQDFCKEIMDHCLNTKSFNNEKLKVILVQYKVYLKMYDMEKDIPAIDDRIKKFMLVFEPFHPEDVLQWNPAKLFRERYLKYPIGKFNYQMVVNFIEKQQNKNILAIIEGMRSLYYHRFLKAARAYIRTTLNKLPNDEAIKLRCSVAYFELRFGNANASTNILADMLDYNIYIQCIQLEHAIQEGKGMNIRNVFNKLTKGDFITILLNPDAQTIIYKYYVEWFNEYSYDLKSLCKNTGKPF